MAITPQQARAELARRELARRELARRGIQPGQSTQKPYFSIDNAANIAADVSRPVLEIGGALAGGAAGLASPVPGGAAIGGAGGYAVGKSAADLIDRKLGRKAPLASIPEAALEIGESAVEGIQAEIGGQVISKFLPPVIKGSLGLIKKGAKTVVPPVFKTTMGMPEKATEMVIDKPSLLRRKNISDEQLNESAIPVIDGIRQAKERVGQSFGKIYNKLTGLNNPIDDFINDVPTANPVLKTRSYQEPGTYKKEYTSDVTHGGIVKDGAFIPGKTHVQEEVVGTRLSREPGPSLDALKLQYQSALDGSLLKKKSTAGGFSPMDNQEKLATLTILKRRLQAEASSNMNAITLKPIDTVKDAAIKKMISQVDVTRGNLPNGKRLAVLDDAWKEIHDIYAKVQKDFSDPGKGRDTLMRLMRGESNWMTQGRNTVRVNAIKRAEEITGKELLKPALEELAAALYQSPIGFGIKPAIMSLPLAGSAANDLFRGNIGSFLATTSLAATTSPKLMSLGLRGGASAARGVKALARGLGKPGVGLGLGAAARSQFDR